MIHDIRGRIFQFRRPERIIEPGCHPLLLWHNNNPVGTVQIDSLPQEVAALRLVAIDTPWQACGHGRALLQYAENFVRDLGCNTAVVYSTLEAVGFYLNFGYAEEDWDDTYLSGFIQMLKKLG
ncbi:MAG TPA: GNAT family N-acetyltransferase [Rhodopila sp.]|nr:GNAT family N-acetyltransferase [Rhodopila sp.]